MIMLLPSRPPEQDVKPEPKIYLNALAAFVKHSTPQCNHRDLPELLQECKEKSETFLLDPTPGSLSELRETLPKVKDSLRAWGKVIEGAVKQGVPLENLNGGDNGSAYRFDVFMRSSALLQVSLWRLGCDGSSKPKDIELNEVEFDSAQVFQEVFQLLRLIDSIERIPRLLQQLDTYAPH